MKLLKSIDPSTEEVFAEYEEFDNSKIDSYIERSERAFRDWRKRSFNERSSLLLKARDVLLEHKDRYALLMTKEMGKPITQAVAEIEKCAWVCEFYAEKAEEFLKDRMVRTDASESMVVYDPIGPVLAVMPWNFPFWQVFRFAAPALMAGNTGILKHASNVTGCALAIEEVFRLAGLPEGCFSTLIIDAGKVEKVICDSRIKAATLTGSEKAGASVASIAGSQIKKTVMELGGSDAFIVLDDADLDRAAKIAALARTINSGQSCIAAKRFIVTEEVYDLFLEKFIKELSALVVGDPREQQTQVGPLARADLREELSAQVTDSLHRGAKRLMSTKLSMEKGYYFPVTLVEDHTRETRVFTEETFGPVAAICKVKDVNEALDVANSSRYGLGCSIWTKDLEKAVDLARNIEAGSVFINGLVKSDPRLPFGGVKMSGYGRELSQEGIREFVNIKTLWIA